MSNFLILNLQRDLPSFNGVPKGRFTQCSKNIENTKSMNNSLNDEV